MSLNEMLKKDNVLNFVRNIDFTGDKFKTIAKLWDYFYNCNCPPVSVEKDTGGFTLIEWNWRTSEIKYTFKCWTEDNIINIKFVEGYIILFQDSKEFDNTKEPEKEWINHPAHYGGKDNPYEFIKVAEDWGWTKCAYLFSAGRYMRRAGEKHPEKEIEDLEKSVWYLKRKIKKLKGEV